MTRDTSLLISLIEGYEQRKEAPRSIAAIAREANFPYKALMNNVEFRPLKERVEALIKAYPRQWHYAGVEGRRADLEAYLAKKESAGETVRSLRQITTDLGWEPSLIHGKPYSDLCTRAKLLRPKYNRVNDPRTQANLARIRAVIDTGQRWGSITEFAEEAGVRYENFLRKPYWAIAKEVRALVDRKWKPASQRTFKPAEPVQSRDDFLKEAQSKMAAFAKARGIRPTEKRKEAS